MKKLGLNIFVLSFLLFVPFLSNAQKQKTKATSVNKPAQKIELSPEIPKKSSANIVTTNTAVKSNNTARVSDYLSLEKKIMAMTVAGDIPASLPKHIEGQTKGQYNQILLNWARNNLSLIKEEYHAQITNP